MDDGETLYLGHRTNSRCVCLDLTLKRCIVDYIYICALKEKCFPDLLMRNG